MKEFDFHGLAVHKARRLFFILLEGSIGLCTKEDTASGIAEVAFITGYGEIKEEMIRLLNDYNIVWHHPANNGGCIVADFDMRRK